jgi:hypothetical protein
MAWSSGNDLVEHNYYWKYQHITPVALVVTLCESLKNI